MLGLGAAYITREKTMNKLLGVSIAALLAVSPMMAHATLGTPGSSVAEYSNSTAQEPNTTTKPQLTANNGIASVTYVQGAYDTLVEKHNALDTRVGVLEGNGAGSVLKGIEDNAENATYTADTTNGANLTSNSTLNTAIDTLDQAMGAKANLSKTATGADSTGVLQGHNGTLVEAVQKVADALDSSNTSSSITEHNFIGKTSNTSTTVSGALTALDTATYANKGAIDTLADKAITVYTTWGQNTVDRTTTLAGLTNSDGTATTVTSAAVPTANN